MSFIFMILAAPWLAATGIYNPQVVDRHGHCIAEPGGFYALYFPASAVPAAHPHHYRHGKR
jgi:hypothetical protein